MKPSVRDGALVGALLSAPLVALSYLGWKVAALPFAPFDLFDWLARALPGAVVTRAIEGVVAISRALGVASLGATAKAAEQVMAVVILIALFSIAGAVLYGVLRLSDEPALLFGAVLGGMLGGGTLVIEQSLNRLPTDGAWAPSAWILATFLAWGLGFGWTYDRLSSPEPEAASGLTGPGAVAMAFGRRRCLVQIGALSVGMTAVAAAWARLAGDVVAVVGERWSSGHTLPNADTKVAPLPGTRKELTPIEEHYRIDIDTRVPVVDGRRWRLKARGLVAQPVALSLEDIRGFEPVHQFVTLECVSNPLGGDLIGTTRWTGVSLQRLLGTLGPSVRATHLKLVSVDGFFETVALDSVRADPSIMLAYAWDGVPLSVEHGFPLRLCLPGRYGMKQPKWIDTLELVERWEPGYWVSRGWDREGVMKATAVIDRATVATVGSRRVLRAGGMAHAGAEGISSVAVRVDEGPWQEAELRAPLSATTWVLWRADVACPPGERTLSVRAVDGSGRPQSGRLHTRTVRG